MNEANTVVEILQFDKFPTPKKYGVIGMVFGRVIDGLTVNYFSTFVHLHDLDEDGHPIVGIKRAISGICYEINSEIVVALRYLQEIGIIREDIKFYVTGDGVQLGGWSNCWDNSDRVDVAFFLEDVCEEFEANEQAFSKEWFYAKMCQMYFSDYEEPNTAFTVGILVSQMWTKLEHEKTTLRGIANQEAMRKANQEKQKTSMARAERKKAKIASYWHQAQDELGAELMRKDSNAAHAIFDMAMKEKPESLVLKSSGKVIGAEAIRKILPNLRREGKL